VENEMTDGVKAQRRIAQGGACIVGAVVFFGIAARPDALAECID